jgi:isopenicillin-N epimerase
MDRREFLTTAGAAASAGILAGLSSCGRDPSEVPTGADPPVDARWSAVRSRFLLAPDRIHLAGLLLAPHPDTVRQAIEEHRRHLDANPAGYVEAEDGRLKRRARDAAAGYMGVDTDGVGLTDSTTMGIGLTYAGLRISEGQEVVTTDHDYPATHHALEFRAVRDNVTVRRVELGEVRRVSRDALVDTILGAVSDRTRALALTWVHSSTGLKLPVRQIADGLAEHNDGRSPDERAILCLDGVHGLGVEDEDIGELGCDVFFAGTHKWVFGPRGTGVIWAAPDARAQVLPTLPTFIRDDTWGGRMSPGGFKPFEHQWSMAEAFEFHEDVGGRTVVRERIHTLARELKEGLSESGGVELRTPMSEDLSSGIVAFDVEGLTADSVVELLGERGVIASAAPYEPSHARFTPGLLNTDDEMEQALAAVREIAS